MIPQLKRNSARLFLISSLLVLGVGVTSSLAVAQADRSQTPSAEPEVGIQSPSTEVGTPSTSANGGVQSPSIQLNGSVQWSARYGLGDGRGLSVNNFSSGFNFSQSITLNTDIQVPVEQLDATLALLANLDTSQPEFLQSVQLRLEGDTWSAEYGGFPMGREGSPFASSGRTLTGVRGTWRASDALSVQGTVAQVSGVKQTKTFRGNTAEETVRFAYHPPDRPLQSVPYLSNLDGLQHFPLGSDYVEGFTTIELAFRTGDTGLTSVLENYGLDYLRRTIQDDPARELSDGAYAVVFTGEEDVLVLKQEFLSLVRSHVRSYIDDYNTEQGLTGDDAESYPLSEGTQYERAFLEALSESVRVRVDSSAFALDDAQRQRFYSLGRTNVQEDALSVEIRRDDGFVSIDDPELTDFTFEIYGEPGVLELDAPSPFFEDDDHAMRATFRYRAESQVYVLGLSVLPGSESVFINDERIPQGPEGYLIQYEEGVLILQRQLDSDDVLRIEYETARGFLGAATDYSRSFQGTSLQYQPNDDLTLNVDLFRAADVLQGEVDPSTIATMPNAHWVAGVSGQWQGDATTADVSLGTALNRFPPDDNQKENLPNRVNVIETLPLGDRELVLFGHRDGLVVYDGLNWSGYSATQGLAGPTVHDVAVSQGRALIATSGGLSVVELDLGDPSAGFARRSNWTTIGALEGLPSSIARSVLVQGNVVWIGTDLGLATAALGAMTDPQAWTVHRASDGTGLPSDEIGHLAAADGALYVGTSQGLVRYDPESGSFQPMSGLSGSAVHDLASSGNTLYAATDLGVRTLVDGRGVGWPVFGQSVQALDVRDGTLWYGTEGGLFTGSGDGIEPARGRSVTAIGGAEGAVWAGEQADEDFNLQLYRVRTPERTVDVVPPSTTGLGGRAENRYRPVPAEGHTETGWQGRTSISHEIGPLTLNGTLESVSPGFSPMGAFQNSDQHRVRLGADYRLSEAVGLNAYHEEGLLGLFAEPYQRIRDGLGVSIQPGSGPTISLNSTLERIDRRFDAPGFDRRQTVYEASAEQGLWNESVTLRVAYSRTATDDLARPANSTVESRISTRATLSGPFGINVDVGYQQPLTWRFDQVSGNRTLNWGANWSNSVSIGRLPLSLQASYGGSGRLPAQGPQRVTLNQNASLEAQGATLRLGSGTVTPSATVSADLSDLLSPNRRLQFNGRGTVRGNLGRFDGRLRYERQQGFQAYSQLTTISDSANLSLSYLGFPNVRPTLRVSGNLNSFAHPVFGQVANGNYEVATEVAWQSSGPLSANLTLARRAQSAQREGTQLVTYSFTQRLSYALMPELTPSARFNAEYRQGTERNQPIDELRGEVGLEAQVTPIPNWSATVAGKYLFGVNAEQAERDYNSFAFSVDFGRDFSF